MATPPVDDMTQTTRPKICDKKLKTAELKINKILQKIDSLQLNNSYTSRLEVETGKSVVSVGNIKKFIIVIFVLFFINFAQWLYFEFFGRKGCTMDVPAIMKPLFRPPEDCSMCIGVNDVVRLENITSKEFEDNYAYGATPVIVTDATAGWKALQEFDFKFFAEFYQNTKMGKQTNDCYYFAYKSGINSLTEVFNMDEKRANMSGDPWYVGWSTCFEEETRKLRVYYKRPYFLPTSAESQMVDWIFMGGPGQGAHMHVDSVKQMSWQAQIRGRKQWELAPPPECLYYCSWFTFTVAPGEILVVDTNRWYHKTNVLPGDISITIGAEYD
ncbi:hypothetical protein O3G_MSEX000013 [Manduca sexta]|nr:hypothetical protein O3G_MSEX000013 [Manduca sexta]